MTHNMVAIVAAASTTKKPRSSSSSSSSMNPKQLVQQLGIGCDGKMPWHLPADLKHFREATTSGPHMNAVVMGRKTWDSIPTEHRPLKGRINVILTRRTDFEVDKNNDTETPVLVANSLQDASDKLAVQQNNKDELGTVFVIGGEQVYREAIDKGYVSKVLFTEVSNLPDADDTQFDAFFPVLNSEEWNEQPYGDMGEGQQDKANKENAGNPVEKATTKDDETSKKASSSYEGVDTKSGIKYRFLQYTKRNVEELQYLNLCRDIISNGIQRGDRTGTGTLSIFGTQLRFDLRNGKLPLLTTKRTFWRGVAEELLWFISVCVQSY